ncbi:uncharacterized protein M6B38_337990 [Iris pallida]|uniref:Uncharacterized protein n=1 Tax=Iris pallida TaxID=29817 RepID=A0AAX6GXU0_IRIPA|nr:uncharacterized protein M6B38_337990 [Iris pallida]
MLDLLSSRFDVRLRCTNSLARSKLELLTTSTSSSVLQMRPTTCNCSRRRSGKSLVPRCGSLNGLHASTLLRNHH